MLVFVVAIVAVVCVALIVRARSKQHPPAPEHFFVPPSQHAIVIGASIGGLATAAVLARYFQKVTIYEKDNNVSGKAEARKSVPQSNQLHTLLLGGLRALETLLPGITSELLADGATSVHISQMAIWLKLLWVARPPSSFYPHMMSFLCASRPFLESHLYKRVSKLPNVTIVSGVTVTGLLMNGSRNQVTGVQFYDNVTQAEQQAVADFVAECSGRQTKVEQFLEKLSLGTVPVEECDAGLGYATAVIQCPNREVSEGLKGLVVVPRLDQTRACFCMPIENGQHMLLLVGYGKDYPPTQDRQQLEQWFAGLPQSEIALKVLKDATFVNDFVNYHIPPPKWRHFEQMQRFPENFVCLGDTICSLNPTFAQGMTHALLHADILDRVLLEQRHERFSEGWWGVSKAFQARAGALSKACWELGTRVDYARSTTNTPPAIRNSFGIRFEALMGDELVTMLVQTNEGLHEFSKVQHCLSPPESVLALPHVLFPLLYRVSRALWNGKLPPKHP